MRALHKVSVNVVVIVILIVDVASGGGAGSDAPTLGGIDGVVKLFSLGPVLGLVCFCDLASNWCGYWLDIYPALVLVEN